MTRDFGNQLIFGLIKAAVGEKVYYDRDYRFREVPDVLNGATYFLFSNSAMQATNDSYVHFRLFEPATLYVAIDAQAGRLPGWMDMGWLPIEETVSTDDIPMKLYKKEFGIGEVSLGGNWMPPSEGVRSHYLLFVVPRKS